MNSILWPHRNTNTDLQRHLQVIIRNRYILILLYTYTHTYLSLGSSDESVPPEQLNEGNLSLQQCQPHSNTAAWTKTKGHVCQLRSFGSFFRGEPTSYDDKNHGCNYHLMLMQHVYIQAYYTNLSGSNFSGSFQ